MTSGFSFLKSFGVTARRFFESYIDDAKWFFKGGFGKRYSQETLSTRQGPTTARGVFAVQYPRERLPLPERYRGFPFLLYDQDPENPRCTACGMCARVCPPQCIWIVRAKDAETGKPLRKPAEFHIDVSICMSCGFCAEFCPFNAIKMNNEYEIATFERETSFLWDQEELLKPVSHHAELHPADYAEESAK
jgi:NADH-quinone oxidoreductase subunit I